MLDFHSIPFDLIFFFVEVVIPPPSQLDPPRYCRLYKCLWLWYPSLCVYTSPFCPLLLSDPHRVCVSLSMAAKTFSRGIEAAKKKSDKVNARVISSQFQVACSHSSRNDWYTHRHMRALTSVHYNQIYRHIDYTMAFAQCVTRYISAGSSCFSRRRLFDDR